MVLSDWLTFSTDSSTLHCRWYIITSLLMLLNAEIFWVHMNHKSRVSFKGWGGHSPLLNRILPPPPHPLKYYPRRRPDYHSIGHDVRLWRWHATATPPSRTINMYKWCSLILFLKPFHYHHLTTTCWITWHCYFNCICCVAAKYTHNYNTQSWNIQSIQWSHIL